MNVSEFVDPPRLVVYLDLDGVVHHEAVMWHGRRGIYMCPTEAPGRALFEWLHHLDKALQQYPQVRLVLSSSWCIRPGYGATLKRFPVSLRERFVGGTFHKRHHGADPYAFSKFRDMPRGIQILQDVERRQPLNWLAIDDDAEGWPDCARDNLIRCDGSAGLSSLSVQAELREKLLRHSGRYGIERGSTEQQEKLVRYVDQSPHFTPAGALAAVQAALKKAGR